MDFRTAGVIGGGVMGADMALDLSANGYQVILLDISDEKLKAAEENIKKTFRLVQLMRKENSACHWKMCLITFNSQLSRTMWSRLISSLKT